MCEGVSGVWGLHSCLGLGHSLPQSLLTWGWREAGWPGLSACPLPGHTQAGHQIALSATHMHSGKEEQLQNVWESTQQRWYSFSRNRATFLPVQSQWEDMFLMLSYSAGPSHSNWDAELWACSHTSCCPLEAPFSSQLHVFQEPHSLSMPDTQDGHRK